MCPGDIGISTTNGVLIGRTVTGTGALGNGWLRVGRTAGKMTHHHKLWDGAERLQRFHRFQRSHRYHRPRRR